MMYLLILISYISLLIYVIMGPLVKPNYLTERFRWLFVVLSCLSTTLIIISGYGNLMNPSNNYIFNTLLTVLLIIYIIFGVVLLIGNFRLLFNRGLHSVFGIIIYFLIMMGFTDFFMKSNSTNVDMKFLTIVFSTGSVAILTGVIVLTKLKNDYKKTTFDKKAVDEIFAKRKVLIDKHYKYIEERRAYYNSQIDLNFLNTSKNDLWLNNTDALNYLFNSGKHINNLKNLSNYFKSNSDKPLSGMRYINKEVESLYVKLWSDFNKVSNEYNGLKLGADGELIVDEVINIHKYIINLSGLTLSDGDSNRVECDNILITDKGVFILEVKNYGSQGRFTLNIDVTGRWEKVYNNKRNIMDSPFAQNSRHIGIIKNILFERNIDVPVYGIVVIANDTVNIVNYSEHKVVRVGSLMDTITNFNTSQHLDLDTRNLISSTLLKLKEPDVKHSFTNYSMYIQSYEDIKRVIELNSMYTEEVLKDADVAFNTYKVPQ